MANEDEEAREISHDEGGGSDGVLGYKQVC